jgi:hypothetical protein
MTNKITVSSINSDNSSPYANSTLITSPASLIDIPTHKLAPGETYQFQDLKLVNQSDVECMIFIKQDEEYFVVGIARSSQGNIVWGKQPMKGDFAIREASSLLTLAALPTQAHGKVAPNECIEIEGFKFISLLPQDCEITLEKRASDYVVMMRSLDGQKTLLDTLPLDGEKVYVVKMVLTSNENAGLLMKMISAKAYYGDRILLGLTPGPEKFSRSSERALKNANQLA